MGSTDKLQTNVASEGDDQPIFPPNLFQSSPWSLQDLKHIHEIGKGKDTVIYSATCPRLGGRTTAVKVYDRSKVAPTKLRAIKREIAMMMFFSRQGVPNVVEFHTAFQDENHYYIVMEYCAGGDLLENLLRDKKAMSERRAAAEVIRPLLTTLARLHALNVIHRDIKLENIFIDDGGRVKLGDFGLTMSMRQEAAISPVGTVEYMAPEVVALPSVDLVTSGQVRASTIPPTNEKVDIWALGVTLYELVTGRLPFEGKDKVEIKGAIKAYRLSSFPSFVSSQCQAMVRAMLAYDPTQRPSAQDLLDHPFIKMYCSGAAGRSTPSVVSVTVRAGPPTSNSSGSSSTTGSPAHKSTTTTPAPPLVGIAAPMSASSREVSAASLTAGSMAGQPARKISAGSWAAALRRFSAGHKAHPDTQGAAPATTSSGSGSEVHDSKLGVKGAVRRIFSGRKSAPHQLGSGEGHQCASVFSGQLTAMTPVMHR